MLSQAEKTPEKLMNSKLGYRRHKTRQPTPLDQCKPVVLHPAIAKSTKCFSGNDPLARSYLCNRAPFEFYFFCFCPCCLVSSSLRSCTFCGFMSLDVQETARPQLENVLGCPARSEVIQHALNPKP